jgi:hypothetical protein
VLGTVDLVPAHGKLGGHGRRCVDFQRTSFERARPGMCIFDGRPRLGVKLQICSLIPSAQRALYGRFHELGSE